MKARVHQMAISRSFTRTLSIVAFAVAAFSALEVLSVQPALAGIVCCTNSSQADCLCDPSLTCSITSSGKFYGFQVPAKTCWNTSLRGAASTIKSRIDCVNVDEASGLPSDSAGTTIIDSTSLKRSGRVQCSVRSDPPRPDHDDTAFCQLDLSYSRPAGLTTCTDNLNGTSTLAYAGFCQDAFGGNTQKKLTVTGSLKCGPAFNPGRPTKANFCVNNDCILNLGIAGASAGQCSTLFPTDGKVLSFSQTVEDTACGTTSEVTSLGELDAQYCNGGTFDNAPVACISGTGRTQQQLSGFETSEAGIQFDVTFAPPTLNLNCGPNNNDTWHFTIKANQHLTDLARIEPASLTVEGVAAPVTCDAVNTTVTPNTRTCHVQACIQNSTADVGPAVCANSSTGTSADITVAGRLDDPETGTAIFGEDKGHKTTGCQK